MKFYYCSGTITYTDNSDETPWHGEEVFENITQETSKKRAKIKAVENAMNRFEKEININYDDVKVIVDEFYETDGLAMI